MWWEISPQWRAEFEDWHTHEHFPERLGIPGFLRGSRWAEVDGGEGYFVLYELETYETAVSDGYLARLNAPTPWSRKMMPHHRNMVRSTCRVLGSTGGALSGYALTVRLAPGPSEHAQLRSHLQALCTSLAARPGVAAGHLLETQTPVMAETVEQRIRRGSDAAADWIFVACGYDRAVLEEVAMNELSDDALVQAGARAGVTSGLYRLSHSNTAGDIG